MAKTRPGLPDGFQINLESPSTLGDYLDEGFDEQVAVARAIGSKQRAVPAPIEQHAEPPIREQITMQTTPQPRPQVVPSDAQLNSTRNDQVLSLADARGCYVLFSPAFARRSAMNASQCQPSRVLVSRS